MKRSGTWLILGAMLFTVALGSAPVGAERPSSTLITYSTVERLLSGGLLRSVTIDEVNAALAPFPADWPVVGMGTTDWVRRNGELVVDGTAGDPNYLWVDPGYDSAVGRIVDLEAAPSPEGEFPFLGVAVADPATAASWTVSDVPDVHAWLEEKLVMEGIDLAAIQVQGEFSAVQTSVAYNIPLTGLDLSGGYVGDDFFRYGDYLTSTWIIEGMYAADPALQPVVSTAGHPLHLHGYQPDDLIGGHIQHAAAISATVTAWPLVDVLAGGVQADSVRVLGEMADATADGAAGEVTMTDMAALLRERGAEVTEDEDGQCVSARIPGSGRGIGLVAYVDTVDAEGGTAPVVEDGEAGAAFVGSAFGEQTGASVILDIARRLSALPAAERPELRLIGLSADPALDGVSSPCSDSLVGTALTVLLLPMSAESSAVAGAGPVVVFDSDAVPDWVEALIDRPDAVDPQVIVADSGAAQSIAAAGGPTLNAPLMIVGPAQPGAEAGDMAVAVSDVEETVWLLIELLNEPAARAE